MDQILEEARICQEKLEELKMAAVQVRSSRSYSSWEDKKNNLKKIHYRINYDRFNRHDFHANQ